MKKILVIFLFVLCSLLVFGKSVIRTTQDWPTYFDPAVGSDLSDTIAMVNFYDTLVFPQIDGSIKPFVAEDWEVSADGLTYTFSLRDDVVFHSGNTMSAEDVAYSMNRLLEIGEGFAYLFAPYVESAEAVDESTVQFNLKQPFGPFILALARLYIVDKDTVQANAKDGSYGENGDYGRNWLLTNDAGSGPYMVEDVKMEEYVKGVKYDEYWGGWEEGAPEHFIEMGTVEPITVRTLMGKKELEITDNTQPIENYEAMDALPGVDIALVPNGMAFVISLHTQKAPTDDIHFRKALSYLLDYETCTEYIYPGSLQSVGPVTASVPGHAEVFQYTFDLAKAEEELKQSKYYGQLDDYPVELSWAAEAPEEEKIALLFQAACSQLGITININKKPFGSMIADAASKETTPNAAIILVAPHYAEAGSMLHSRYHSSSCGTWEQNEWLQNDEIDALIDDALSTPDTEERFEKYAVIQEKIVELCPTIWMFDFAERRAYQDYVDWPTVNYLKEGNIPKNIAGYELYFHDMKIK